MSSSGPVAPRRPHAFRMVLSAIARRWRTCLALVSVYAVLVGASDSVSRTSTGIVDPTTLSAQDTLAAGVAALAALFVLLLVNVFVLPLTLGSLALVGSASVYDDHVDTGRVLRRALDRGLELVGAFIVTLLILGAGPTIVGILALVVAVRVPSISFTVLIFGFFLLLIPVVYLLVRLSLAPAVVMREQRGAIGSVRRSWQLVSGHTWAVFRVAVLPGLFVALLSAEVAFVSFVGRDTPRDFVLGFVTSAVGAALSAVLFGVGSGVMYALLAPEDATTALVEASHEGFGLGAEPEPAMELTPPETLEPSRETPAPPTRPVQETPAPPPAPEPVRDAPAQEASPFAMPPSPASDDAPVERDTGDGAPQSAGPPVQPPGARD